MHWSDLPLNPSKRMLRQFAALCIVIASLMAAVRWHDLGTVRAALLAAVAFVGAIGLVSPMLIRPVFVGWTIVAFPIGWLVSRVVMLVLFFGVFTPVGVALRSRGRDLLRLNKNAASNTYWSPRQASTNVRSYLRQF